MAKYISIHTESFRRGSQTSIPGFSWSEFNLVVFEDMDERRSIVEMRGLSCWQKRADHPKTPLAISSASVKDYFSSNLLYALRFTWREGIRGLAPSTTSGPK